MFIDELELYAQAGNGGNGCVSFRREKYIEFGGPDGGNGGHGGSVIVRVRPEFNTLLPLRTQRHYRADKGTNGRGSNMTGANGKDLVMEVPRGTIVRDRETGTILGDLTKNDSEIVVARGGRGGKGNRHFASSTNKAPKFCQPGEEGEELWLKLELKIMADVGLVGFPNAGKSTLISRISAARPKVADYPFTTLVPSLGVVSAGSYESFVVADIPGIIEGAHEGAGLGLRFLRHIERTSVLLVMVDPSDPERGPEETYNVLINELASFNARLANKTRMVAFTKADVPHERDEEMAALTARLDRDGETYCFISSVRGDGLDDLVFSLKDRIAEEKARQPTVEEEAEEAAEESSEEAATTEETQEIDPLDEI